MPRTPSGRRERRAELTPAGGVGGGEADLPDHARSRRRRRSARRSANLAQARVNLERTTIRSPVNGYITNLQVQLGDYATAGQSVFSIVDANSYWVDGYFEETIPRRNPSRRPGDGQADGLPRPCCKAMSTASPAASRSPTRRPGSRAWPTVNPIFTWVRLAQRVPVRIQIDQVPDGVSLVAGQTASVQIEPTVDNR